MCVNHDVFVKAAVSVTQKETINKKPTFMMIFRSKYLNLQRIVSLLTTEHGERWYLSSSVYLGCHGNCSDKQQKTPLIPNCVQLLFHEK